MPIRPIPVPELQVRLQDNSGIIDSNTDIDIPFLERQLSDFNQAFLQFFPNTNAPEYNLNIEALKSNIQQYLDEGLSHLGFYYGFQLSTNAPNSRNKIRLIMKGDKLDDDNPTIIARSSSRQFSDANLSLTNGSQFNSHRTRFKNRLADDFNHGLYIRLDDLMAKLNELQRLRFDTLNIRLGFRPADVQGEGLWNCIHLIFRGSSSVTTSDILFSTFDASDEAYDGPKLGIPPFGETVA